MEGLKISVAMCTYNGARFLEEQLESIASQTARPFELIVCDDGSDDHTIDILRNFSRAATFPVKLFEARNRRLGCTKNFERAIGLCTGQVICLADQDDIWEPEKLVRLGSAFATASAPGYLFSDAELIDERSRRLGKRMWSSVGFPGGENGAFEKSSQVSVLLRRAVVTGATMAFRASLRDIVLPLSPYFVHDYWISMVSSCVGSPGVAISEPLTRYRRHSAQQIGPPDPSWLRKIERARNRDVAVYQNRMLGCDELLERLHKATRSGYAVPSSHFQLVSQSFEHAKRRVLAHSERGPKRLSRVARELFTGRYSRFSNSWASVVEDLCF
jgi:glycosyltransferase involved in cell wall biosynthesis